MSDKLYVKTTDESAPLHELLSSLLASSSVAQKRSTLFLPVLGTMQPLNQRLAGQPGLDFLNYTLRGIGQVIFVNNPLSGLLILVAVFIQSPWVGVMVLLGAVASTLTALWLRVDRDKIRDGFFGFNGVLVAAALATFGLPGNGPWNLAWAGAVLLFSAMTTVLMKTIGIWFVTKLKFPPLSLPYNIATLLFVSLVLFLPQPYFDLVASAPPTNPESSLDWFRLAASLPLGFGQVFFADQLVPSLLIFLAVAICTPIGAVVGLLGSVLGVFAGLIFGAPLEKVYEGAWGYNAVLAAVAIGGVFYTPTYRAILIGAACAFLCALAGGVLNVILAPVGLPILTVPLRIVTIGFFIVLQRFLPSLVPVPLNAVVSPEEHWQRYLAAKNIITNFRRQLNAAMRGTRRSFLFEESSSSLKGDLRYVFNAIDTDRSGTLSIQELAAHLRSSGIVSSKDELAYLFTCMDVDSSSEIDFEEFGELMLRHRRLMASYAEFVTYFLPLDANGDDLISIDEMNVALSSVGESPLSGDEVAFLQARIGGQPITWNRFTEMLLVT